MWHFHHKLKLHFHAQPSARCRKPCRVPGSPQICHRKIQKLCLCLDPMVCYIGQVMILAENQTMWDNQTSRVYTITCPVIWRGWWDLCKSCDDLNIFLLFKICNRRYNQRIFCIFFKGTSELLSSLNCLQPAPSIDMHKCANGRRVANQAQPASYASKPTETRHSRKLISCFPIIPSYPMGMFSFQFCF